MRISLHSALLFLIMPWLMSASSAAPSPIDRTVEELLASHPAGTFQEEQTLCTSLLDLGPDAVKALCRKLSTDGSDARQRTVLLSLAMTVGKDDSQNRRRLFVQAVSESLQSSADKETQAFLIELLQQAGHDECVERLSGFLTDDRLCNPAVRALTAIGTPKAAEVLLAALADERTADKAAVILALGNLRVRQAAERMMQSADSKESALRQSARWALANIGYEPAGVQLAAELTTASGYPRGVAASNYLLLAQRLAEKGQPDKAAAMCRRLLSEDALPGYLRAAALETLVSAVGQEAMEDLLAAGAGNNEPLQAAAVALADRIEGTEATRRWMTVLKDADARLTERIVEMLGRRRDKTALPSVLALLGHSDSGVSVAAMAAAVQLDQERAVEAILAMLKTTEQQERIAAGVDILMRLPGENAMPAAAQSLPVMPPKSRIKLIEGLANRRAAAYSPIILAQTADPDPAVRRAAIQAMAFCAVLDDLPKLLTLMLQTEDTTERLGLQRAVIAAAMQNPDSEKRADPILERLPQASGPAREILLRTAGRLGGANALKTVVGLMKDQDSAVKDAAIRALTDWPDAAAVPALMEVVAAEELRYQVIALRAAVNRMQDSSIKDPQKLQFARQALKAVTRNEEKQLILSLLGQIKTLRSLTLAAQYMEDESLRTEAAVTVAKIALPVDGRAGLEGVYVAEVLTKARDVLTDDAMRQQIREYLDKLPPPSVPAAKTPPDGFTALFNGRDLTGWRGVLLPPHDNPVRRAQLGEQQRAQLQAKADEMMRSHWRVKDGILFFDGGGFSLTAMEDYADFELHVDWKIAPHGDSGIYLRGAPQVQIWDPADWPEGSGGLYNNQKNPAKPLVCADNPVGSWNTFRITMIDQRVTVYLNDTLIVDNVILENYWDRSRPIFPTGPIELQCHGDPVWFNNIFIRRIESQEKENFVSLFNGTDLTGWIGDTAGYAVEEGAIVCRGGRNLYTEKEYGNFHFKCQFRLTPGANNGIGIRSPRDGDSAFAGMEIQILDDTAEQYANLQPYQYDGSIYGVVPARRGHLKPLGQWNTKEIIADGSRIRVILNDALIVDADLAEAIEKGTLDGREHPGLSNTRGHIVFLGHGSEVAFRNIQIRE